MDSKNQIFNTAKTILNVTNEYLNGIDTSFVKQYNLSHDISHFHGESGKEHYRLLMFVSSLFESQILFDVGTNTGVSALALSNSKNKVKTYDVVQLLDQNPFIENVEFILGDSTEDKDLEHSPLIFLDVNHDGSYEDIFYKHLHNINWKGFLLLDDIHINEPMINFWNNITEEKYDITSLGHWSGTGLVVFN